MLKTSVGIITSIFLLAGIFSPARLGAQSAEKADRTGLESVWKKSGRTTGVIDYPYSPQPGIYGGKTVREWGNRGYIFINPRADEFIRRRPSPKIDREEIEMETEDCRELREELLNEVSANEQLRRDRDRLAEELREAERIAGDRGLKIEALEFQIEELERASVPADAWTEPRTADRGPDEPGPAVEQAGTYMVREGDSLWKIAGLPGVYNDPYRWLLLYHANRDQIFLPDLIYPGMVLLVPRYRELEDRTTPLPDVEPAGEEAEEPEATPDYEEE
jgi:hypothetical protein